MLYDTTADVIRKALRGLGLAPSEAASLAGMPERDVIAASRGEVSADILTRLAPALGLHPGALAALPSYVPPPCPLPEVIRLELPFDDETVNAWLVDAKKGNLVLFDTGDGTNDVREALNARGISQVDVLITHEHGDHTGGLPGLRDLIRILSGPQEDEKLRPGDLLLRGTLSVRVIGLPGHCEGALGYVVEGLSLPICVTGDALFAGSMGGCAPGEPYRQALEALWRDVMSLPPETIILPGHGPATTVGSEMESNPFVGGPASLQ